MGPTASGKTDLAIAMAEAFGGELISVDSALVYRGLDIGSAKPEYPHHLINICDPLEVYSAAQFVVDAQRAIDDIRSRGKRPILVGGSMLYFRALFDGLAAMPAADPALRKEIEALAAAQGWPAVHARLATVDPDSAARIHPNHSQRLTRALEVYQLTGRPLSELHSEQSGGATTETMLAVAIAPQDRAVLHARIAARFTAMLSAGFLDEVATLRARDDLNAELPAIRAVGYRQLWEHLAGECSLGEACERALAATRQLAKRQFTWLRKWPELRWIWTTAAGTVAGHDLPLTAGKLGGSVDAARLLEAWLVEGAHFSRQQELQSDGV
jgi:tRNA dimethylallyltransferase